MLTALVLVCSLAAAPTAPDCYRGNAIQSVQVPEEFSNPATCLMHGQAYLAETSLAADLRAGEYVKVVCIRSIPSNVG